MGRSLGYIFFGKYDYTFLCTPQWPWCRTTVREPPAFFATDAFLGVVVAAVMGFQHALSMVAGLITPPILVGGLSNDPALVQYLIQATLIITGIFSAIQVWGPTIPFTKFRLGSGILSVMGASFTTVPIAQTVINGLMDEGYTFDKAYGAVLGTIMVASVIPMIIAFMPNRIIRNLFPPIVCGVTIMLIGINLVGSGMKNWGGGVFCGDNTHGIFSVIPNCTTDTGEACYSKFVPYCNENGDVILPFGSPIYLGLGAMVFGLIILFELFGSPFMRNTSVALSLFLGYGISAAVTYNGQRFVTGEEIQTAPWVSFLWVDTNQTWWFPLSFYAPALLPLAMVFCITSLETVGDISATEEASRLENTGPEHERRVQGGLLNDGVSGLFSALGTSLPLTTFAQNNGVISLTAVAARQAGFGCASWLFLLGLIGKFGAIITSIPVCVLGGMTTFLFANVISSGIKIVVHDHLNRRNRFILGCALAMGIGVTLVPEWAENALWPVTPDMSEAVKGVRQAVLLCLEEGFVLGAIVSFILNLLLPTEDDIIIADHLPLKHATIKRDAGDELELGDLKDSSAPNGEAMKR